jgi:hypothetical protein
VPFCLRPSFKLHVGLVYSFLYGATKTCDVIRLVLPSLDMLLKEMDRKHMSVCDSVATGKRPNGATLRDFSCVWVSCGATMGFLRLVPQAL